MRSFRSVVAKGEVILQHIGARNYSMPGSEVPVMEDVVLRRVDTKRVISLNRPAALNALNLNMIRKIYPKMQEYEGSTSAVDLVIIKGLGDKAFCAGGDIRAVAEGIKNRREGRHGTGIIEDFFRDEYKLNYLIGTYEIPYIALIDGITMGGGVGLSVHGPFRVASDRTVFAMPETAIGFFPDVGGTYFLPRLKPMSVGVFLALTGFRLKGLDVLKAGIATHYVHSSQMENLEKELIVMDPGRINKDSIALELMKVQAKCLEEPAAKAHEYVLEPHLNTIDRCFSAETVEEVLARLQQDNSDFAKQQLAALKTMSPTSLKVTLRAIHAGAKMTLKQCLVMEYRLCQRFCEDHDFYEGVRAMLIDKDKKPRWNPTDLSAVTQEKVNRYFSPLPDEKELVLID